MPEVGYFFIDGAYVRAKFSEAIKRVFNVEAEPDVVSMQMWLRSRRYQDFYAQKFFYYDCLQDVRKDNENEEDFKRRVAQQEAAFERIQSLPGFHVRLGSLSGEKKRLRQKKVDVLLAVDMLDHAFRKNMVAAYLLAGDADFVPVVEAVTKLGTWVEVYYHPRGASKELYWAADQGLPLDFNTLWDWSSKELRRNHRLPNAQHTNFFIEAASQQAQNIKTGTDSDGQPLYSARSGINPEFILSHGNRFVTHTDRDVLEKYYNEQYGQITWGLK